MVAIACNWLPHNLTEVAQAIEDYMDGKEVTLPGPDFPTGGVVINKNDIPAILKTGHGSVKVRGKYNIEKQNIIFYEIPYGTTIEGILESIAKACENKDIEGISEAHDESNKKGIRLVIKCNKDVAPETIVRKLFAKTSLQNSISYNQVALIDKTPTELNLVDCIKIYIEHNIDCLKKEITFDLEKAKARLHIVEGLLIALEDIDNIIQLIKQSESAAAASVSLQNKYKLTEIQAKAILDMKLAKLAKLEKVELENEKKELIIKIGELELHLKTRALQEATIRERLQNIVKIFGDKRRTELTQIEVPKEEKEIEEVIPEDVVVIVTQTGNVKRIPKTSFKTQKKNGKGVKNEDNAILDTISTNTIDNLMIFTSKGKMYKILVDNIPVGTNVSKGINISSLINMESDEKLIAVSSLHRKTNAKYVIFITKKGLFKKTRLSEYTSIKRSTGIAAIKLKEGDSLANVTFIDNEEMIVITKLGMAIRFETEDIAPIGRITSGVKSIKLSETDEVLIGLPIHKNTDTLALISEKGFGKKVKLDDFPLQARGGKGLIVNKDSMDKIAGAAMIDDEDILLLIGQPNSICITAKDVPLQSRITTGSKMIKSGRINSVVKL